MDIAKLAYAGPGAVEAAFGMLVGDVPGIVDPTEKFMQYRRLLTEPHLHKINHRQRSFLAGYFAQQAGMFCNDKEGQRDFFQQSLADYQFFQDSEKKSSADMHYFAQWQIGILQHSLQYEWSVAEESFLMAMEYDAGRGEALREVIIYQCTHENWPFAYIYSTYCKDKFLGKTPVKAQWYINIAFYQWKILKYHISILLNLHRTEHAKKCVQQLLQHSDDPELSLSDKLEINSLCQSWEKVV